MSKSTALFNQAVRVKRPVLLAARISAYLSLRRQRAQLADLDAERLRDIGLTREQARTEARRPTWDVPTHWHW